MNIRHFNSEAEYLKQALQFISDICQKNKKTISIALSGGSTPLPLYKALAKDHAIPFDRIELFQVDERYVSKNHPDSNRKMIEEYLISKIHEKLKGWNFFDTSFPIEQALQRYDKILNKKIEQGFNLIILGIGNDGHIASIFPNTKFILEQKNVTHTHTEIFTIRDRLTITLPMILKSEQIIVLLRGKEKLTVIEELKTGTKTPDEFPTKFLLKHPHLDIFFLEA